jgi:predicted site-specific integrase-resolvase
MQSGDERQGKQATWTADLRAEGASLGSCQPTPFSRLGNALYIRQLLETLGRQLEVLFPSDTHDELVDDFVAVMTSMAVRLYGRRNTKRRVGWIQACVKRCVEQAEEA